jgi:hypothetical protein
MDFEAIEMAMRSALHQAGEAALTELLKFDPPGRHRGSWCACGHTAHYVELRSKTVLTAVGSAEDYAALSNNCTTVRMRGRSPRPGTGFWRHDARPVFGGSISELLARRAAQSV